MDRYKFSGIAHSDHTFWSPLSAPKADTLLGLIPLVPSARVLDVGCGPAELLIRLAERQAIVGVGVDQSPYALVEARLRASRRVPNADLMLHELDVAAFDAGTEAWDLAMCVGSSGAYGGYRGALEALRALVRPGGHVLLGELYWKQEPDSAYLAVLGGDSASRDDIAMTTAENVAAGQTAGLIPLYISASSEDEWDHYEGLYARAIELYALSYPDDPDSPAMLARIGTWRDAYLRHGRATLGFALYLFHRP